MTLSSTSRRTLLGGLAASILAPIAGLFERKAEAAETPAAPDYLTGYFGRPESAPDDAEYLVIGKPFPCDHRPEWLHQTAIAMRGNAVVYTLEQRHIGKEPWSPGRYVPTPRGWVGFPMGGLDRSIPYDVAPRS